MDLVLAKLMKSTVTVRKLKHKHIKILRCKKHTTVVGEFPALRCTVEMMHNWSSSRSHCQN